MACNNYDNFWRSDFNTNVSAKDGVQDKNPNHKNSSFPIVIGKMKK